VGKTLLSGIALFIIGCATAERSLPAPVVLPEDGATVPYAELHPKLRQLAWKATEAFYRDDWKDLGDTAQQLDKAARLLKAVKDTPARLQAELLPKCDELTKESGHLKEAAAAAAIDRIGVHLQRINNLVRELRPDA
jgi:hypothetical protein